MSWESEIVTMTTSWSGKPDRYSDILPSVGFSMERWLFLNSLLLTTNLNLLGMDWDSIWLPVPSMGSVNFIKQGFLHWTPSPPLLLSSFTSISGISWETSSANLGSTGSACLSSWLTILCMWYSKDGPTTARSSRGKLSRGESEVKPYAVWHVFVSNGGSLHVCCQVQGVLRAGL